MMGRRKWEIKAMMREGRSAPPTPDWCDQIPPRCKQRGKKKKMEKNKSKRNEKKKKLVSIVEEAKIKIFFFPFISSFLLSFLWFFFVLDF